MSSPSHSDKLIGQEADVLLLVRSYDDQDRQIYFYIMVRADKLPAFRQAILQPTFRPKQFGDIIDSGYGEPAPETMRYMQLHYHFDHQNMVTLRDTLNDE